MECPIFTIHIQAELDCGALSILYAREYADAGLQCRCCFCIMQRLFSNGSLMLQTWRLQPGSECAHLPLKHIQEAGQQHKSDLLSPDLAQPPALTHGYAVVWGIIAQACSQAPSIESHTPQNVMFVSMQ